MTTPYSYTLLIALLLIIGGVLLPAPLLAQPGGDSTWANDSTWTNDSTWADDSTSDNDSAWKALGLDPEGFKYDDDVFGHVSTGWFPQPFFSWSLTYSTDAFYSDTYDRAMNLRSSSLQPTAFPFTWCDPYEDSDERKIMKPNSDKEEDDGHPSTSYNEHMLTFILQPPIPLMLRLGAGFHWTEGLLYSNDTTRAYLSLAGVKRNFREEGVVYLKEVLLSGYAGLQIPVYGGFIDMEALRLGSYYYLFGGLGASWAFSSKATQYVQIANVKDDLRYSNGTDTVTLIDKAKLPGLNTIRTSIELGVGWNLAFDSFALGFELFGSIPQTSVLKDADWKQYVVGARFSIGYQWTPAEEPDKALWP